MEIVILEKYTGGNLVKKELAALKQGKNPWKGVSGLSPLVKKIQKRNEKLQNFKKQFSY
jgi:hypothetical protein